MTPQLTSVTQPPVNRPPWGRAMKWIVVGVACMILNLALLDALVDLAHWSVPVATLVVAIFGAALLFLPLPLRLWSPSASLEPLCCVLYRNQWKRLRGICGGQQHRVARPSLSVRHTRQHRLFRDH